MKRQRNEETCPRSFRLVVIENNNDCSGQMGCYRGCGCYTKEIATHYSASLEDLKTKRDQLREEYKEKDKNRMFLYHSFRLEKLVWKPSYVSIDS